MKETFVFFGTPSFSVIILDELKTAGYMPSLIVTQEDKHQGRHLELTPPPVKAWALANGIECIQPATLKDPAMEAKLRSVPSDIYIVASYGKIIPQAILDIPAHGTLNVHPSLLPRLRGPSPVVGAILSEDRTGISIMELDAVMDHGPLVAQKEIAVPEWPAYGNELEALLAREGGKLLAETIHGYAQGTLKPAPQDHSKATFTKKFVKADMEIDLHGDAEGNLRKIRAFAPHAHAFFTIAGKKIRVIIRRAKMENGSLILEQVLPEGRKEMSFKDFEHGFLRKD